MAKISVAASRNCVRRSPSGIAAVVLLVLAALVLLWFSIATAYAGVWRERDPQRAAQVTLDGLALAELSVGAARRLSSGEAAGAVAATARLAAAREPTAAEALYALALLAGRKNDRQQEAALYSSASSLSLRVAPVQSWLGIQRLREGDIAEAFPHLHAAMTISGDARANLAPLLGSALANDAIYRELAVRLRGGPTWANSFFRLGIQNDPPAGRMSELFAIADRNGAAITDETRSRFLLWLVEQGELAAAAQNYERTFGHEVGNALHQPGFEGIAFEPPFGWDYSANPEQGASSLQFHGEHGNALQFFVSRPGSGFLARQLVLLPSGRYRFAGEAFIERTNPGAMPRWIIRCAAPFEALAEVALPEEQKRWETFSTVLLVPEGCSGIWLVLESSRFSGRREVRGYIDNLKFERL